MKPPKINLLDQETGSLLPRRRFSFWKGVAIALAAAALLKKQGE